MERAVAVPRRAARNALVEHARRDHAHRLVGRGGDDARQRATGFGHRPAGGGGFTRARAEAGRAATAVPYAVGDDVVHASFGEGVVTAVEAGSVVVVRFAGDGAERKLMADYAPLQKVA